ncbi:unnamed protein product [Sphenostylis stenocarpa]|uniref:Uncharacterized protein n=1 Tax=Sphenostylis stenocarpa TaxID=92480 RepID=A0AA86V7Z5_9FABA|nr:unnamed protein product [Sphenostylis stenocarpa]
MAQASKEPCKKEACDIQACLSKNNFLPQKYAPLTNYRSACLIPTRKMLIHIIQNWTLSYDDKTVSLGLGSSLVLHFRLTSFTFVECGIVGIFGMEENGLGGNGNSSKVQNWNEIGVGALKSLNCWIPVVQNATISQLTALPSPDF